MDEPTDPFEAQAAQYIAATDQMQAMLSAVAGISCHYYLKIMEGCANQRLAEKLTRDWHDRQWQKIFEQDN